MPGLNLDYVDPAFSPVDDLFRHVNGGWLATAEIAADRSSAGASVELSDNAEAHVREIIESLSVDVTTESGKVAALYRCFLDEASAEELGVAGLQPILQRIDAIDDTAALAEYLGWALRHGLPGLVDLDQEADPGEPSHSILFSSQDGLGLPDEAYYRDDEHAEIRQAYREHLRRMFELAGRSDAQQQADWTFELETKIAFHHWDRVRARDLRQAYNPMAWDEFTATAPGFDWDAFLAAAQIPAAKAAKLVITQPSFMTGAADLVATAPMEHWRAWARWKAIAGLARLLSSDFVEATFDFYGRTLQGTQELRPRWKRAVSFAEDAMGEAVGKLYVERHFPPEAKQAMDKLVANLLAAYHDSISALDWMTDETRAEALAKLAKFTPKIGYPDKWKDYSALSVSPDDLVGNALAVSAFHFDDAIGKVGKPVDPLEWQMYPQTVNAYYHPLRNEIVFPAAILQPPFFNLAADDAVNYGGIGAIIGHEIGHGFDDQGSTCDGDGRLRDWWTEADRAAFEERTGALVAQYDVLSPDGADGLTVNGKLTIGENIGDLGGIDIAYRAWLLAGGDPDGEAIDGLTPAQRFFFGWASSWRSKRRPELTKQLLAVDPHSPDEFRCNQIVRNLTAFHAAFGVTPGDGLWLDADQRVKIW
ncbi:MAG: peptidase M13 [Arachnia propionica]|nr:MAG: peptidase M13 [Arachnia propionica]